MSDDDCPKAERLERIEDAIALLQRSVDALADELLGGQGTLAQIQQEEANMADALSDAFAGLSAKVDAAVAADTAGAAELQDLTNLIKGMSPGTALTADQINQMAAHIDAATSALSTQTSASASATDQPAPAPTPAPTPPAA